MIRFAILLLCLWAEASAMATLDRPTIPSSIDVMSDGFIDYINKMNTTWKAGRNFARDTPLSSITQLLGVKEPEKPIDLEVKVFDDYGPIPESFDAREQWPACTTIGEIRDQGQCGSCWAFGAVEAMSDRLCIATKGQVNVQISAEDLNDCCDDCGGSVSKGGCNGGYPSLAFKYYQRKGLVTGGLYGSHGTCKPYTLKPNTGKLASGNEEYPTPICTQQCASDYSKSYLDDKHFGQDPYRVIGERRMQSEILQNGPIEATFLVYSDFISYRSGVYQRHSNSFMGAHAIKILGWGVEGGIPYWLVANSWNTFWGDGGFFKILRGQNECQIEAGGIASLPRL